MTPTEERLKDIETRSNNLVAMNVTTGKDLTMAEVLTVDVPWLIAELRAREAK